MATPRHPSPIEQQAASTACTGARMRPGRHALAFARKRARGFAARPQRMSQHCCRAAFEGDLAALSALLAASPSPEELRAHDVHGNTVSAHADGVPHCLAGTQRSITSAYPCAQALARGPPRSTHTSAPARPSAAPRAAHAPCRPCTWLPCAATRTACRPSSQRAPPRARAARTAGGHARMPPRCVLL